MASKQGSDPGGGAEAEEMSGEDSTSATTTPAAPDPLFLDLAQRVARLEERTASLEKLVNMLKEKVESIEAKVWWIITGVGISILLQILLRLIR
jgi:hypothetical protein